MNNTTTWTEMLDEPRQIEIRPVREGRMKLQVGSKMLYPNGRAVDAMNRTIPEGVTMTPKELAAALADEHGADVTCPVTTGRCLHLVAEAASEAFQNGTPIGNVTPIWRVLDARASTLKRVLFDSGFVLEHAAREAREPRLRVAHSD